MANTKITNPELFNLGDSTSATQLPVMTTTQRIAMNAVPTLNVDYLVVAGGGAGASGYGGIQGGGGGGGGFITSLSGGSGGGSSSESPFTLTVGTQYAVTVGAGGQNVYTLPGATPTSGGDSSAFNGVTALGGGNARSYTAGNNLPSAGSPNYASGGGGTYTGGSGGSNPGSGTSVSRGYSGGNGTSTGSYYGGGGGGAGGAGSTTVGGAGKLNSLTGNTSLSYSGGGGNSWGNPRGGAGQSALSAGNGNAAINNTGGGGGGGRGNSSYGGNGGSGIIILRYPTADVAGYTTTGLTPTETTVGTDTVLSFTTVGTGTITFTSSTPIGTISTGEMIFNSTTDKVEYWDGTKWYGITYEVISEADLFGDGSNMFTSNFSNSTPDVIEGNGASIFVDTGTMGFDSNVPRPGFVKSLVGTANQVNQRFDWSLQTGYAPSACKAYSFWVYNTRIDDDDNLILSVNIKRQNYSTMWVYAWDSSGTNEQTHDQFSTLSTNAWHHMTVVDEGTTMRTYIDGVSAGTHTIASSSILLRTAYPILYQLSDADARNTMFTTGIRMFDRPLTAAEVTTLYDEDPDYGA